MLKIPHMRFLLLYCLFSLPLFLLAQEEDLPAIQVNSQGLKVTPDTLLQDVHGILVELPYTVEFEGQSHSEGYYRNVFDGRWELSVLDAETGIELFSEVKNAPIHEGSTVKSYKNFMPFSYFPYPKGAFELNFTLSLQNSMHDEVFLERNEEVYSFEMPEMKRVHLEFGPFHVRELNHKGRKWDRPFIFGNGIPEFFWSAYVGSSLLFESDYIESEGYPSHDEVDFFWEPGTSVKIEVADEDDVKRDFAGSSTIFRELSDLPIDNPKATFGQVYDARLKVDILDRPRFERIDSFVVKRAEIGKKYLELDYELVFSSIEGDDASVMTCAYINLYQNGEPVRMIEKGREKDIFPGLNPYACPGHRATRESFHYLAALNESREGYAFKVDYVVRQHERVIQLESKTYPFELTEQATFSGMRWIWLVGGVFLLGVILGGIGLFARKKKA